MKTKHALIILLIGFIINIIGAFLKITHLNFGFLSPNITLFVGSLLEITGALLFLFKLFTYPKFKDFMNW